MDIAQCIKNNRLRVKVTPNSRTSKLIRIDEQCVLHLAIAAPPDKGKANAEVERFLKKLTGRAATVKSGFTSKEKLVLLK